MPLDVAAVACPVHPLCGAEDVVSPPAAHRAFHAALGAGTPVRAPRVLARAAHALHWERPDAVVAHVARALGESDDGR